MLSARRLAPLMALALSTAACGQAQPSAPTAAPPKPTTAAPAASPAASPVASPSPVSPVAKPAGLASPSPSPSPSPAAGPVNVELRNANGQAVGTATFTTEGAGIRLAVQARDLPPGPHGLHVHAVGRCDPPDFMTAGGHFNPTNRQHGLRNPAGPHAGDLPNLEIAAGGTGNVNVTNTMMTLDSGPNGLFDADGSALVIHAMADDDTTDPTGNSGGRIACGVIAPARS